jgi:c-di-GMP-binding flagellar brake protein YcgR
MAESDQQNRRKYPRLCIQLPVKYKLVDEPETSFVREITNTIGQGGVFIRTKTGLPKKNKLSIEIDFDERTVTVNGEVRYLIPYDTQAGGIQFPGMGIQFIDISEDDMEFIGKFVEEGLKKKKKPP